MSAGLESTAKPRRTVAEVDKLLQQALAERDGARAQQAMIAIENARLLTELQTRTNDLTESLEYQTATAEVLGVISASPGTLAPVFEAMLDRALRLCEASFGALYFYGDGVMRLAAESGVPPEAVEALRTVVPEPGGGMAQIVEGADVVQVADAADTDAYRSGVESRRKFVELTGSRTALWIALRKDNALLGVFIFYRREVRPFSDKHVALLQNFADQAVIAIENARLFTELNQRTSDLMESLEYQTATSDVLKVISRSTFDLQPVLDTLTRTAGRLCNSDGSGLTVKDGDVFRYMAIDGTTEEFAAFARQQVIVPSRNSTAGRVALEGKVIHIPDLTADPDYMLPEASRAGIRTLLGVPLLREGAVVGTLTLARYRVEPFTERQVELVRTFADQAVIAIENARLLTELRESLDRQTATADVLGVISASPGELAPVFDTILEDAMRLCEATTGHVWQVEGDNLRIVASRVPAGEDTPVVTTSLAALGPVPLAEVVESRAPVLVADLRDHPSYRARLTGAVAMVEQLGTRSMLSMPIMKDGLVLGVITLYRREVRPFAQKHLDLVQNFADQAVIAIENARLLTELRESLDRQTATADILRAIASTPGDPTRALDTIAETAARMFDAANVGIRRLEGDMLHMIASAGPTTGAMRGQAPARSIDSPDFFASAARENSQFHVPDMQAEIAKWPPDLQETLRQGGVRTAAFTPLTRDGKAIGAMGVNRTELRPFRPDELQLMTSFADQAVIAMDNARLLGELRESLEQQQAMAEVLQVINSSPGNLQPVFNAILDKAHSLCGANIGWLLTFDGELVRTQASHGLA
ncbi:MAG: GAF domain-containing protein, partial [Stellaceae bacterium]